MDDLISRQAAIDALSYCQTYLFDSRDKDKKISLEDAEYAIEQLPSVQPERKKGKWILKPNIYGVVYCSECDYELHTNNTNYCPDCGAKMEVEHEA